MTSKATLSYLKGSQSSSSKDSSDLYRNFSLNKGHKCSKAVGHKQSKSNEVGKQKTPGYDSPGKPESKKDGLSLKKSSKNLSKFFKNDDKKDARNDSSLLSSKIKSSSTLSLHIAAYENFIESQADGLLEAEVQKKSASTTTSKNLDEQLAGLSLKDQFEFPRQQEDRRSPTPEIQQFTTSQRLFAPLQEPFGRPLRSHDRQQSSADEIASQSGAENVPSNAPPPPVVPQSDLEVASSSRQILPIQVVPTDTEIDPSSSHAMVPPPLPTPSSASIAFGTMSALPHGPSTVEASSSMPPPMPFANISELIAEFGVEVLQFAHTHGITVERLRQMQQSLLARSQSRHHQQQASAETVATNSSSLNQQPQQQLRPLSIRAQQSSATTTAPRNPQVDIPAIANLDDRNAPASTHDAPGSSAEHARMDELMGHLSKLAPFGGVIACSMLGKLRPQSLLPVQSIRLSHAHVFRRRNGQLIVNRVKDMAHFYMVVLGSFPFIIACAYTHIVYGPCELKDYPEEGQPPPRYWQFERTPLRQLFVKYFGVSDMEHHERNLAYFERQGILTRWRRTEDRVKHLQGELADYKGYFYMPVSAQWVDYGRYMANRQRDQYESHASYGY